MELPRVRYSIWRLMTVIAIVACSIAVAVASSVADVLTGWAALCSIPALLILARSVPPPEVVKAAGRIVLIGLCVTGLVGLLGFAMNGYLGLIGGSMMVALMIGWGALLAAALAGDRARAVNEDGGVAVGIRCSVYYSCSSAVAMLFIYNDPTWS
jgi:hypothetical protein